MAVSGDRIRCTSDKRTVILGDIAGHQRRLAEEVVVECALAEKLVGRLCNLSQIYPEILPYMHGGYAVSKACWQGRTYADK